MHEPTPDAHSVTEIARRHGVSPEAVLALLRALIAGHGTMAQFDHPDLGGLGQWSQGGMTMVGAMFDRDLKARVNALSTELAALLRDRPELGSTPGRASDAPAKGASAERAEAQGAGAEGAGAEGWPSGLGRPATAGSQNNLRYAVFPAARRLAIARDGRVTLYDTGDHLISGVSQQQSSGQSLTFTSQHGAVPLESLPVVPPDDRTEPSEPPTHRSDSGDGSDTARPHPSGDDPMAALARLADLHGRGVLTDDEFAAKKADLLARI